MLRERRSLVNTHQRSWWFTELNKFLKKFFRSAGAISLHFFFYPLVKAQSFFHVRTGRFAFTLNVAENTHSLLAGI